MYLVFDSETETHSSHKRKASPFNLRNWVVARGWKHQGNTSCTWTYHPTLDRSTYLQIPSTTTLLVGFNLKFDLLWEMAQENPELLAFFKRGGRIWDCQYVEYLLQAQHPDYQMCSLDQIIESYGGTKKIDAVKAMWEEGYLTSQIPEDLLIDYLVGTEEEGRNGGDIRNTELVFLGQVKKSKDLGMVKMIQDRMDGLCATIDMEFRGLKVDTATAAKNLVELKQSLEQATAELDAYIPDDVPFEFRWTGHQASALIFGGTLKYQKKAHYLDPDTGEWARYKIKEAHALFDGKPSSPRKPGMELRDGVWFLDGKEQDKFLSGAKKGEPKFKQVSLPGERKERLTDFFYSFPGYTKPNEDWATKHTDGKGAPIYSTSGDVLDELAIRDIPFLKTYTKKQALDKEIGTYYVKRNDKGELTGMLTCVQPQDHMLHHKLNHTSTITTRLSSSDPNLQNLPRGDKSKVKQMFVSRFPGGKMIEADYSQLEVVIQGVLSKDPQLCNDLRARVDFHCKRVSKKFGISYEEALDLCKNEAGKDFLIWKMRRNHAKVFSFQRAYGAGAAKIAATTGIPIEDVHELIAAEEELYPGVVELFSRVQADVQRSPTAFNAVGKDGHWHTYRRGYWIAPTGTRYGFRTYDAPDYARKRGATDTFMPTELKNYPVQGTGGEFVQGVALGKLWRHFISTDYYGGRAYLVHTVHDCVWADCQAEVAHEVGADMKRIMESIPDFYNNRHGMDIDVPFPVEVEYGDNMYELKHMH